MNKLTKLYLAALIACLIVVLATNYLMALAGAPQQQWFYCHVLELCKGAR